MRDWLYVADHCEALARGPRSGDAPGETYNVGGLNERTNIDIVDTLCDLLDELCPSPTRLVPLTSSPSSQTARATTAAMPSTPARSSASSAGPRAHTFEQGIRKTVRWYLDHRGWCARISAGTYRRERLGLGAITNGDSR